MESVPCITKRSRHARLELAPSRLAAPPFVPGPQGGLGAPATHSRGIDWRYAPNPLTKLTCIGNATAASKRQWGNNFTRRPIVGPRGIPFWSLPMDKVPGYIYKNVLDHLENHPCKPHILAACRSPPQHAICRLAKVR